MAGVVTPILEKTAFEELFGPLTPGAQTKLAELLLSAVSSRIRKKATEQGVEIDGTDPDVHLVVYELVSAVLRHHAFAGLSSVSITTDDATEQRTFANALRQLDITDAHWDQLGLAIGALPRGTFPVGDY